MSAARLVHRRRRTGVRRREVERGLTASVISAVNLSEVMHRSLERGVEVENLPDAALEALGVGVLAFDGDAAEEAANLGLATRAAHEACRRTVGWCWVPA